MTDGCMERMIGEVKREANLPENRDISVTRADNLVEKANIKEKRENNCDYCL